MPVIALQASNKNAKKVNFFLLHSFIPKTGGTALLNFFRKNGATIFFDSVNNLLSNPTVGILNCPTQHFHYELLNNLFNLDRMNYSFTIVRNPIDRIKSDYVWSQRGRLKQGEGVNFDQWVDQIFKAYQKNPFVLDNHIRPQVEFVGPSIKRVFKYESGLDLVVQEIFKELGLVLRNPILLEKENTGESYLPDGMRSKDIQMKPETMEKIVEFYVKDFETFGYKKADS